MWSLEKSSFGVKKLEIKSFLSLKFFAVKGNDDGTNDVELEELPRFETVFFWILLPPIMLEAAFDLHKKDFINILTTVLLHAVLGTFINFFLVGGCLCIGYYHQTEYFGPASKNTTHAEIFVFSSLVSAVGIILNLNMNKTKYLMPIRYNNELTLTVECYLNVFYSCWFCAGIKY